MELSDAMCRQLLRQCRAFDALKARSNNQLDEIKKPIEGDGLEMPHFGPEKCLQCPQVVKLEAERDAWICSMQAAERKSDARGEVLGQLFTGCTNRQDYAGASVIAKVLNYPNNKAVSGDADYQTRLQKLEVENKRLIGALEHIIEYWNQDENPGAMFDALHEILAVAKQALAPPETEVKDEQG